MVADDEKRCVSIAGKFDKPVRRVAALYSNLSVS